ncbi:MAG: leucine-rich repeat protein, partial [Clostridia bacterium]|nr:leucine-rich repeat protein [Clostridia bacterium]
LAVWCATDFGSWSTPIYNRGFYVNGEKVTALVVPEGAERIGNYAFSGSGITSVYIPASVTEIGIRPFFGCSLNSIEISADNPAFVMYDGCIYTKDMKTLVMCPTTRSGSFEVPSGVETIADNAFSDCKGLTSVYIPFGVKSIGNAAFSGCEGLTYIYVPAGVKTIGGSAFSHCKNLTSVEIGEGVESIGDNAFYDCKKLATAWIPSSVTSIGGDVLFSALYISYDARPELFYGGSRESWEALTKNVRSISFKDPKIHYNSKLPVRGIGGKCGGDVKWTLNESGVFTLSGTGKMDDYELYHQTANLVTVDYDMPEGFTAIEPPWYSQREYIKKVIIEDGITYIGSNAFADCENLESVSMAAGVEKIGNEAFYNCKSLKAAELPRGLTVIGNHAFCECPGLEAAQIPEGVTEIGESAFSDCEGLKSLTIPSSTAKIGRFAFGWCRGLTSVTVPSGVKSIESSAFYECSGLTSLEIQPGVETIGYSAFFGCAKLTKVEIPETVTRIDMDAFAECHGLLSVTIPSGVTAVKSGTFYNCKSLSTVTIPVSVTSIGESAFTYCGALSDIYYGGSKSQWQSLKKSGQGEKFYSANMHYGAVDVEDISIDPASVIMEAGNKKTLSATVAPEDATDKTVTWSTSDESVAAVDENGTVTAIAEGTAVITAASGNVSAKCSVTVTPAVLTAVDFTVNAGRGTVKLTWNEVSGATDYRVYRKTADGEWEILASEIKELSYTDSAAKRGMTYTYTVRAGKKGLSPKYPAIEGAYSLDITVPEAPPPYQSVTDPATGESISCLYEENTVTVSGDVSSETPVCVALYDENGRLVSVKVMNAPGTADAGSGYAAKVIWLNAAGFTSKGECMEFELN